MQDSDDITDMILDSGGSLVLVDGLQGMLTTIILPISIGLVVVIVLVSLLAIVSRLRSQRATIAMQKDIRIIREIIERQYANRPDVTKDDPQLPPKP